MKAKELMINDWVAIDEPDRYAGATGQIESLYYHQEDDAAYFQVFIQGKFGYLTKDVCSDDVKPIPLTDAILKANGFEYRHKNFAALSYEHPFQLEMVEWPNENGMGLWMAGGLLKIRYVHELQHALRLFGIDKEIKLEG